MFSFKRFVHLVYITLCFGLIVGPAIGAEGDEDFLRARQAFSSGDNAAFEKNAAGVSPSHPLFQYLTYWRLQRSGAMANDNQITDFLSTYPDTWLAERVRADWLKQLGRREMWPAYLAEYPRLVRPDLTHQCYAHRAQLAAGDRTRIKEAVALWFTGGDQPSVCEALFVQLFREELINREDVWRRQRLALEAGNPNVALVVSTWLPLEDRINSAALDQAARAPAAYLQTEAPLDNRANRELTLYALNQLAKSNSQQAELALQRRLAQFPEADQRYAWAQLATQAARRHEANALPWFERAGLWIVSDSQREWWVRAALRAQQWSAVASTIDSMTEPYRKISVWRYWRARAHKALGQAEQSKLLFRPLAKETNYYGQLAREELDVGVAGATINVKTSGDEAEAVARLPGIQRAMSFYGLGLRTEAGSEWNWATRSFDDRQLLAAAELARRAEWYDQAINTAEKTRDIHDFDLRYLAPYRELASAAAAENKLDEAWVYGLMRQESRFINVARSNVGASGLMQIMPDTARWIARRLGIKRFDVQEMGTPETNIKFGTYYLKHVQDSLDGSPVLATAAYNAGPGRAQRWRMTSPMEAAVYVETIPFTETRDYVRKVMSNAMYYAARFGQTSILLKDRLGVIPARKVPLPAAPVNETPVTIENTDS